LKEKKEKIPIDKKNELDYNMCIKKMRGEKGYF
jgi:hypothetical protein